ARCMAAPVGIVTGASRGLGLALARALAERGWRLVVDARDAVELEAARAELATLSDIGAGVAAVRGDVSDPAHRLDLVEAAGRRGACPRAPRPPRLRRRSRRHAYPDAAGGVPRRGHLRPPSARGERPQPARADRERCAERSLPRTRPFLGGGMTQSCRIEGARGNLGETGFPPRTGAEGGGG